MISQRSASARALVIISTIAAVLVLLLATAVNAFSASGAITTTDYEVRTGDSLWSIADSIGGEDADLRSIVREIRHLNALGEPLIHPGDVLEVPAGP